jgi:arylsulfatase
MQTQPHIILIMTDQQRYDTIAALGFDYMETPHLDRLVNEGISFNRCYVTGPTCVPSRASFFKGLYPHSTGIYKNQDLWQHSWVEDLSRAGYHCVNVGKMHTTPFETPLGFDERFVVENKDRYLEGRYFQDRWDMALQARKQIKPQRELYRKKADYQKALGAFEWEIDEDLHPDFFTGDMALNWINYNPKSEKPLFLQIGFPGPHPPMMPLTVTVNPILIRICRKLICLRGSG